ncbi:MAG: alpha-glucan family phosphorylase [Phycisphaerae bacterium]
MRPLRTFTIEPSLPDKLSGLQEIAHNLRWCWSGDALDLFRRLDHRLWEECYHNPVQMLGRISQERLVEMSDDEGFLAHLRRVLKELREYMASPGWYTREYGESDQPQIAYFCAEYGISECLPIYSGGLGILAGDHLKSASDLHLPMVAVGLLYQQGYFRQRLNADGWQLELFPRNDFHNMPLQPVNDSDGEPVSITIDILGRTVRARVWKVQVGRIPLYLLDSNVPSNTPEDRHITAQLYGGDQEMRIKQEILLGIGGVRMLRELAIRPKTYHMNEGHSAFLSLERIRLMMAEQSVNFNDASEVVRASTIFTTHTPVPAGNDAFEPWLIDRHFEKYWPQLGLTREKFLSYGRQEPGNKDEPMNLTVLSLRLSTFRNGVSELHGQVSRKLWANVWPNIPEQEVPIDHITNGIHTRTWISHDMADLLNRYLGPEWSEKMPTSSTWKSVDQIPDSELWRTHERRRERLVAFCRRRLSMQLRKRGASSAELAAAEEALDPEALTIGFARRFATYKRASLLFTDTERLARLLNQPGRRVQIIFAGKAHPRDNPGKDLIRQIIHTCRLEPFRRSLLFLEDYDMNVARYLVQGVDVWLNTPLRPMEASGTSGMKVSANGGLNLSIPDGWWAEGYDSSVGWAIGSGETYDDLDYQNAVESQALYDLIEKEIVPLYYERGADNLPRGWIAKMKASIAKLTPIYSTNRMVRDYSRKFYFPATQNFAALSENNLAKAKDNAGWRWKVTNHFPKLKIESVNDNMDVRGKGARVGQPVKVTAVIDPGELDTDALQVELYYGRLDGDGQLTEGTALAMEQVSVDKGKAKYSVEMPCRRSGLTGYTVRVLPKGGTGDPRELGLIKWA